MVRHRLQVVFCGVFVLASACGLDDHNASYPAGSGHNTTGTTSDGVVVYDLPYQALQGTVEIRPTVDTGRTVTSVELLAGPNQDVVATASQAPYQLLWDTTTMADGVVQIAARVIHKSAAAVTSSPVPVLIVNKAQKAAMIEGDSAGQLRILANYTGEEEIDIKYHWLNPANVREIIAGIYWVPQDGQKPWDIGVSVGKGICPHRGVQYGPEPRTDASPVILDITAPDVLGQAVFPETPADPNPATDWYFVHMRPNNPMDHKAEGMRYRIEVYLLF